MQIHQEAGLGLSASFLTFKTALNNFSVDFINEFNISCYFIMIVKSIVLENFCVEVRREDRRFSLNSSQKTEDFQLKDKHIQNRSQRLQSPDSCSPERLKRWSWSFWGFQHTIWWLCGQWLCNTKQATSFLLFFIFLVSFIFKFSRQPWSDDYWSH